jgi:DNA-directed RNA polymerase subunit M/transcription elongation factor TFIIS
MTVQALGLTPCPECGEPASQFEAVQEGADGRVMTETTCRNCGHSQATMAVPERRQKPRLVK